MPSSKQSIKFIEQCYRLYEQNMYRVAFCILRDEGLAEDAVQDAFIKLMKKKAFFENAKSDECKRYLITVVKHAAIDIYNRKQKELGMMCFAEEEMLEENPNPEQEADVRREVLGELIENLPNRYYAIVHCLTVEELSVRETADVLHLTEANVRKRFERAKRILREFVKGREEYGAEWLSESGNS